MSGDPETETSGRRAAAANRGRRMGDASARGAYRAHRPDQAGLAEDDGRIAEQRNMRGKARHVWMVAASYLRAASNHRLSIRVMDEAKMHPHGSP